MKIVNGYVCECSDEVRFAKRGIDPANPHKDPLKQKELDEKRGVAYPHALEETKPGDFDPSRETAFQFAGSLSGETRANGGIAVLPPLLDKLV